MVHHVLLRGIERRRVFLCDADREDFLERLGAQVAEGGGACFAWALMPNHVHLVLSTGARPLSNVMHRLNTGYARRFNLRHRRSGYVFQDRFRSIPVETESYLLVLLRYVHRNPLSAGLVASLEQLAAHPWTGHAGLMGRAPRPFHAVGEVLEWFAPERVTARVRLLAWMRAGVDREEVGESLLYPPPLEDEEGAGTDPYEAQATPGPQELAETGLREPCASALRRRGWTLERLVAWVCAERSVEPGRVQRGERSRPVSRARALIGYLATRRLGYTLQEVSRATGIRESAMSRAVARGEALARGTAVELPAAPPW